MANMSIVESVFLQAVEQDSPQALMAFLDAKCPNGEIRREVERLLAARPGVGSFLQEPAFLSGATLEQSWVCEGPGTEIGPYKLMEQIGEGGFGLVFVAEQQRPVRRKVALKVIKPGMDSREVIARFEAERQALALMDHPNIAKVLDAGTTDSGRPYFVMELVKGIPIVEYCDQQKLDTKERLALFVSVCKAVQHAHSKGVIHRDLKPSNIMVAPHDGVPVVKVIDFGVAKAIGQQLTEKTIYTRFAQMIGTPLYMSPEQAEVNALDVDTRSDIYSLGVLLYELLTGTTPFDKQRFATVAFDEMRRIIKEEDPPKPSTRISSLGATATSVSASRRSDPRTLSKLIRGDLDWIVMKALEKDRARRYETASAFADDVGRLLRDEAVVARPPSSFYRYRKFARRNKAILGTILAIAASLLLGLVTTTSFWYRAENAKDEAETERERAEEEERRANEKTVQAIREKNRALGLAYKLSMTVMAPDWKRGNFDRIRRNLQATADWPERGFEWYYWQRQMHREVQTFRRGDEHRAVAVTRDGGRIATGPNELGTCSVVIWDASTGEIDRELPLGKGVVQSIAFSPDDSVLLAVAKGGSVLWDLSEGTSRAVNVEGANLVAGVFSPDGSKILVGCDDGTARLLDSEELTQIQKLEADHAIFKKHEGVAGVAFSPDGKHMATSAWHDTKVCLFKRDDVKPILEIPLDIPADASLMQALCFSPDGKSIAFGSYVDPLLHVWDVIAGRKQFTLPGHERGIFCLDWAGSLIFSGGTDGTARVWDVESQKQIAVFKGHAGPLRGIKAVPSHSDRFVTCSARDPVARIWSLRETQEPRVLQMKATCLAYLPGGRQLAVGCADGSVKIVDASTGRPHRELSPHATPIKSLLVLPDGQHIVTAGEDLTVRVWRHKTGDVIHEFVDHQSVVWDMDLSRDGRWLVVGEWNQRVRVRDLQNNGRVVFETIAHREGVEHEELQTQGVAISPNGEHLITAGEDWKLRRWERGNSQQPVSVASSASRGLVIGHIRYSADGSLFVTGGFHPYVCVWNAATVTPIAPCIGHTQWINDVAISRDGRRVLSASLDGTARLWDAATGDELLTLEHTGSVGSVAISPDGRQIATQTDNEIVIWDAATDEQLLAWQ